MEKVAGVWFSAHSGSEEIDLDINLRNGEGIIREKNVDELKPILAKLPPQTSIIIDGCQAGKETQENNYTSIARKIASLAHGNPVFAPTKIVNETSAVITSKKGKPLEVEWRRTNFTKRDKLFIDFLAANAVSLILQALPSFIKNSNYITHNITAKYIKHGQDVYREK